MTNALREQLARAFGDNGQREAAPPVEGRIPEGERNVALTKLASRMRSIGLAEGEILAALLEANEQRTNAPLDATEVRSIAHSIAKHPAGEPKVVVERPVIGLAEALERGPPPREPLVGGIGLNRAKYVGITGEEGCGKTGLALSTLVSVAAGKPVFGAFEVESPGSVLLTDQENDPADTLDRLRNQCLGIGVDPASLPLILLDRYTWHGPRLDLASQHDQEDLWRIVEEVRPVLLVMDSMRRHHTADENSSTAMVAINSFLLDLAHSQNVTIIAVQQMGKPAEGRTLSQRARGSSDFMAAVEAAFPITRSGDLVTLHNPKNRAGERTAIPIRMTFDEQYELWVFEDRTGVGRGSVKTAVVVNEIKNYLGTVEDRLVRRGTIADALGLARTDGSFARALKMGVKDGELMTDGKGSYGLAQGALEGGDA